ncbi:MAG: sigma-70 family RNA polymerase sigma factor [Planctomycetota bacterium]|jgi:RNA polymerase sigma-70 factor (ECF subfamily)
MTRQERTEEKELVTLARKGDKAAFEGLVGLFQDRVYNLSFRLTGDRERAWDLSQDAFLRAFAAIKSFKGASAFFTWIYRIVLNLHMNQESSLGRKMEKRSFSMDLPDREDGKSRWANQMPDGSGEEPGEETLRKEREQAVQEAIAALPVDYRQAILLRDMEGLSYEEIAELLSIPIGTVRSRLYRAREELRRRLKGVY